MKGARERRNMKSMPNKGVCVGFITFNSRGVHYL